MMSRGRLIQLGLLVAGTMLLVSLEGCTGQGIEGKPFSAANEQLQKIWDGPRSWAEDWCDQKPEFREAYSALVQYRMRPYRFSITCPGEGE